MASMDGTSRHDETSRLIAIGRDRDAANLHMDRHVEAVGKPSEPHTELEATLDSIEQLDVILPALNDVARNVRPDQMTNATPCSDFTVRDVFNHMIGGAGFFAAQFRGEAPPEAPPDGTDLTGNDPVATFTDAIHALAEAAKQPGALERTVVSPFGEVPGDVVARFLALDGMVHTWDLATATGQTYDPPEPVVVEVLAFARQAIAPEMRGGPFGSEVPTPSDATRLQELVAFTGRTI
jgi:uncharacterized protein (TIGR03086 family)